MADNRNLTSFLVAVDWKLEKSFGEWPDPLVISIGQVTDEPVREPTALDVSKSLSLALFVLLAGTVPWPMSHANPVRC